MPEEHNQIENRLVDLEIKASYSDDLLEQLNQIIFRQQQQIDQLSRELITLRSQLSELPQAGLRNLRDELPPHY